jgi:hypothetical protein
MPAKNPVAQGVIFFAVFFAATLAFEAAIVVAVGTLFNARLIPRGLGWVVMPFTAGFAGWAFGHEVGLEGLVKATRIKHEDLLRIKSLRLWVAGSAVWVVIVIGVFAVFNPFDRYRVSYWREEDWFKFFALLVGVPLVGLLGVALFEWAEKGSAPAAGKNSESASTSSKYEPPELVYRNTLWCLIALSVLDGKLDPAKAKWIETFSGLFNYEKVSGAVIAKIAETFIQHGPVTANDLVIKHRGQMNTTDREMLLKFCFAMLKMERLVSSKQRDFMVGIADALEVSPERLYQL